MTGPAARVRPGALRTTFDGVAEDVGFDIGPYIAPHGTDDHAHPGTALASPTDTALTARIDRAAAALGDTGRAVAATLYWKSYSYVVAVRPVTSWARHRRVPDLSLANVWIDPGPGSRSAMIVPVRARTFVLPDDPASDDPGAVVVDDETSLVDRLVDTLVGGHLEPMIDRLRREARVGTRSLRALATSSISAIAARRTDGDLVRRFEAVDAVVARLPASYACTSRIEEWTIDGKWEPVPIRTGCCLAYKPDGGTHCATCHLLNDGERAERLAVFGHGYRRRTVPPSGAD